MANWMGGSCPAMANQIAGGFMLLSSANLKGFLPGELQALKFELEKHAAQRAGRGAAAGRRARAAGAQPQDQPAELGAPGRAAPDDVSLMSQATGLAGGGVAHPPPGPHPRA